MRKSFGAKSWLYPMPVLIVAAYDTDGRPNAMNAAWGGIFTDDHIGVCISEGHKTTKNILATKAFTVSMATVEQLAACDYWASCRGIRRQISLLRRDLRPYALIWLMLLLLTSCHLP